MKSESDYKITEIDKLNFNKIGFSKEKSKTNIFYIIIKVLFIFIFILFSLYFIFIILKKKNIDDIIKIISNKKIQNKEIIKKLDYTLAKLNILEQKILSNKKISNYNNNNIYNLLSIKEVLGYKKIRIGSIGEGGYILLNDLKEIKIAYSFGLGREISFDKGLADKNIDVFMYDHTISELAFENPKFHWKKIGLTGRNINNNTMKTLPELIQINGHLEEKNMILKLDIESNEWDVFQNLEINNFRQFKYIVGEFHFFNSGKIQYYNIFEKNTWNSSNISYSL